MRARLLLPVLISLALLTVIPPRSVLAHGPLLRGREIDKPLAVTGITGLCRCQDQWFTVGLRPGRATTTAAIERCTDMYARSCSITVYVLRRNLSVVRQGRVSCAPKKPRCTHSARMSYTVPRTGVYYVLIRGETAHNITYSLDMQGRVYGLHCRKYC